MKKASLGLFLLLIVTLTVFANGNAESTSQDQAGVKVVATTNIIGDVVKQVLQDNGELTVLMPLGQNPHSYTPTPRNIAAMESADIIFVNGLGLEEELLPVLENLDGPIIVEVSHGLIAEADHHDEHEADHHDEHEADHHDEHEADHHHHDGNPHFWFSPLKVVHWVHEIVETLEDVDSDNAELYHENGEAYEAKILALDAEMRELIERVEPEDRKLVMDHESFEYFADDYGFTIMANLLPHMSDQADPSAKHIAEVVKIVEVNDIRAIFVGGTAGQNVIKMADAVAEETSRPLPVVSLLTGSLAADGRGTDYLDFARYNTEQIVEALAR
ncbi:MAG: metal ABC transporter substrate-binding protein [Spirochaetales bacterium]|uniref:Metal ABC transporter substrate-binding protein n=1 Tax=Candidatus Thalassospirochaeta sargassi TaxID=3119039 RepID=A0AAJ1IF74_9SPIO|nr:metal ABC transporter substrate-binding protein [Spirochaetales bacterium]